MEDLLGMVIKDNEEDIAVHWDNSFVTGSFDQRMVVLGSPSFSLEEASFLASAY